MNEPVIKMIVTDQRLKENFWLPTFASPGSAAVDLRALFEYEDEVSILPGEVLSVSTGLRVWVEDPNYAALVLPRSGLGTKGLVLGNLIGLIDSDYQGPLTLKLWNRGVEPIAIALGDRVAQLVVTPILQYSIRYVDDFDVSTSRGQGGFGSSGVK